MLSTATFDNKIRSFVLRQGRVTSSQQQAIDENWQNYGLSSAMLKNWEQVFDNDNPVVLEIGFGMGTSLVEQAIDNPDTNHVGIEVHKPGVGNLLKLIEHNKLSNIKIFWDDANKVLSQAVPNSSLDKVQIFFPDPWPKKRHHKRRLVQPQFINFIATKIKKNGKLHLATDWEDYARQMLKVITASKDFTNTSATNDFVVRPQSRPLTKFEQRGKQLGHGVWDLIFNRI